MDFLKEIQPLSKKPPEELPEILPKVIEIFCSKNDPQIEIEALKILKIACSLGPSNQLFLAQSEHLLEKLEASISNHSMQLLANICVQNDETKKMIFQKFRNQIKNSLKDSQLSNASSMIIHQIFISTEEIRDHEEIVEIMENLLVHVEAETEIPDFVHLSLEFLLKSNLTQVYPVLEKKLPFLHYVADFIKEDAEELHQATLSRLLIDFKRKSSDILKPDGSGAHTSPKEVFALLEIVAFCSCHEKYSPILHKDSSLFLNLGCLLLALQKLGKTESIFTPIQKLDQIAPSSTDNTSIEQDISYSLKSLVVKSLGNLLYKNKKNQELVREMDILLSILECTNIDARNPLIKEYSILAIRNACEANLENQKIVASLTKVGDLPTPIMTEFTENVIRVKPK